MSYRRTIEEVAETLKQAKERKRKCTLLVGAGCSVTAGVPTANEFVKVIEKKYPKACKRASELTYPACMAQLAVAERRDLIAKYVDQAKINWAHICIAQLINMGYVDRVLTTNFDLLLVRACALLGVFPAVYDFASSQLYSPADIPDQAIIHLHGQRTGFVLMNTEKEVQRHSKLMKPVFHDAGLGRGWLVAGYSGYNDPVFNHLAKVQRFDNNLYWIGYRDSEPAEHVRKHLIEQPKDAYFVSGHDADEFFIKLAQDLGCFPDFASRPFSHLKSVLCAVAPYRLLGEDVEMDMPARQWIDEAIDRYEGTQPSKTLSFAEPKIQPGIHLEAGRYLQAGEYEKVVELISHVGEQLSPQLAEAGAWAYCMLGSLLSEDAQTKTGREADELFGLAGEKCQAALNLKPDMYEVPCIWGVALSKQGEMKAGKEAERLFEFAEEKYAAALKIKPDLYDALGNWGVTLSLLAKTKSGKEADRLFNLACKKFRAALKVKPDLHEALANWGGALSDLASTKSGREADRLFNLAGKKFAAALKVRPDMHDAIQDWGGTLRVQAKMKTGPEADRLFELASEKYEAALRIKPQSHETLCSWGNVLSEQAQSKIGPRANRLFQVACEKYEAALRIKRDSYDAFYNWGVVLLVQAQTKGGQEADRLLQLAGKKYEAALKIKPELPNAFCNWGLSLFEQAKTKTGRKADRLLQLAGEKYKAALRIKPDMHEALNNWGLSLFEQAKMKTGKEADGLLQLAGEKYEAALKIKPDKTKSLNNWGLSLLEQAKTKTGQEADRLFQLAGKKYEAALRIKLKPRSLNN